MWPHWSVPDNVRKERWPGMPSGKYHHARQQKLLTYLLAKPPLFMKPVAAGVATGVGISSTNITKAPRATHHV